MLLANKEAVMNLLNTLNFVAFNPLQNNNPIAVRRRKLKLPSVGGLQA
jgi:hypothetical protein